MAQRLTRPVVGLAVLTMLTGVVATLATSCKSTTSNTADARLLTKDGGAQGCPDAEANAWRVEKPGKALEIDDAGTRSNLFAIWGASATEVYAVGSAGRVVRYDGTSWQRLDTQPSKIQLTSISGIPPATVPPPPAPPPPSVIWVAGYEGTVARFDGTAWQDRSPPLSVLLATDGGVPPSTDAGPPPRRNLWGIWATGTGQNEVVWAVGDRGTLLLYRASTNAWQRLPSGVEEKLTGVWGASVNQVFVVGDFGTVLVGATAAFTKQQTNTAKTLTGIWGRSASDVYAVGLTGTLLHYDGAKWTAVEGAPKQYFRGIWGPPGSASSAYLIGWDGTLLRLGGAPTFANGGEFAPFNCVTSARLEGIWGTMIPTDAGPDATTPAQVPAVWVVGVSGTIIRGP